MPERTDARLPPMLPRSTPVEFPVTGFFTTGGPISASTGVFQADEDPGEEGEEAKGYENEFEKMEWCGRRMNT